MNRDSLVFTKVVDFFVFEANTLFSLLNIN